MIKLITISIALAAAAGCGGTVMTCPRVETPVLLGPVDRIGGTPSAVPSTDRTLIANAEFSFQMAHGAGGMYTSATRTARSAGAAPVWEARLHRDQDIRVASARTSGFVWDAFGMFWMDNEVRLEMAVTKAGAK